jgi:hypothetical protein
MNAEQAYVLADAYLPTNVKNLRIDLNTGSLVIELRERMNFQRINILKVYSDTNLKYYTEEIFIIELKALTRSFYYQMLDEVERSYSISLAQVKSGVVSS